MLTPPLSHQRQVARANSILTALGTVSSVASVATLLYSRLELVILVIAGVALASGAYLVVRRWGRPVNLTVMLAILMMLVGAAIVAVVFDRHGLIHAPNTPGRTPVAPAPAASGTPIQASHRLLYNGKITTFKAGTGYDVDKHGASVLTGTAAEAAPADLYLDLTDFLRSPAGDMFSYFGSDADARAKCAQAIAAGVNPQSLDMSNGYLAGESYCFLTSDGNIGKVYIDSRAIIGNSPQDYIDVTVLVWAK